MLTIVITNVEWKLLEKIRTMFTNHNESRRRQLQDWIGRDYRIFHYKGTDFFYSFFFSQRSVPKSFDQSMTNLQNKVRENNCASKFERCVV